MRDNLGIAPQFDGEDAYKTFIGRSATSAISLPIPWEISTPRNFLPSLNKHIPTGKKK